MEDVLDVYHRPYDPDAPVVCFDECSKQLLQHVRTPPPGGPGRLARVDDEYKRCGTVNIFRAVEPLTGHVVWEVTDRRGAKDCGAFLKRIADQYPEASRIVPVSDNLNTHIPAALCATFAPEQARQPTARLELNHTPKHGSWLNMAETELSIMARQCLNQRIETKQRVQDLVNAWDLRRCEGTICWQFTTDDARIKPKRLHPSIQYENALVRSQWLTPACIANAAPRACVGCAFARRAAHGVVVVLNPIGLRGGQPGLIRMDWL